MGTTAQKLQRVLDTKEGLKDTINTYLGQDITSAIPFKDYETYIKNFYGNLPKTSYAEGTEITLSNTLKGKLDFENDIVGYGQTEQESTNGYQLANIENTQIGKAWNGSTASARAILLIPVEPSTQYTISYQDVSGLEGLYRSERVDEETIGVGPTQITTTPTTITTASTTTILLIQFNKTNITLADVKAIGLQVEKGTVAHNLEKYTGGIPAPNLSYPQEIEVVRGKNRLNLENCTKLGNATRTNETSNSVELTGVGAWSNGTYIFPNFAINTNLRISLKLKSSVARTTGITIYGTNTNDTSGLTSINEDTSSLTANIEKEYSVIFNSGNYKYICMRIWTNYSTTTLDRAILEATEIMLSEGSQATSYLPYNTLEVKIQNKNLCTEMEQGDVSTSTGEASSYQPTTSGFIRSKDYIPVKPSEVITVSYKNTATSSSQIVIFEYNANKTYIGFHYSNASTYTRTLGNETAYIKIRLQDTTNTLSNNTEIQVEYGNTKTSYVEHAEQIKQLSLGNFKPSKIGNYKDYFYRTSGKNLFDNSVERKNAYIGASGSDIGTAITYYNSSATYTYVNCAYVESGKTYTLSWKQNTTPASTNLRVGAIVDNNNIILNTQNTWTNSSTSITFTPNVSGYLVLCTDINATNIQLELGNTATEYNPYGSGKWYFKAKNGYTMLKSALGWIQAPSSVAEGTTRFYCSKSDVANLQATQSKDILSNAFMPLTWNDIYIGDTTTKNAISDYSQENSVANRIVLRIDSNYASSVSELNTFLDNNDFYAYYLKAIPTDTKITDTTMITQLEDIYNLMSYTGTTILEVDGDLPMIIKVRALKGN